MQPATMDPMEVVDSMIAVFGSQLRDALVKLMPQDKSKLIKNGRRASVNSQVLSLSSKNGLLNPPHPQSFYCY